mmetsp:Transcript_1645/g.4609  ORF Transcript_1645/g.4609 Transcript_1645/m.4609 type:complete len:214 (-) Transcript_1645:1081-1722(-)
MRSGVRPTFTSISFSADRRHSGMVHRLLRLGVVLLVGVGVLLCSHSESSTLCGASAAKATAPSSVRAARWLLRPDTLRDALIRRLCFPRGISGVSAVNFFAATPPGLPCCAFDPEVVASVLSPASSASAARVTVKLRTILEKSSLRPTEHSPARVSGLVSGVHMGLSPDAETSLLTVSGASSITGSKFGLKRKRWLRFFLRRLRCTLRKHGSR